jgi:glycosyltransferase involved in cell wall biosynthesis
MAFVSLIIPALNEEAAIGNVLSELPHELYSQILVADNGSTDRTAEIAAARGATVVLEPRRGYGNACLAAIARLDPRTDIVVFMDADSSDVPSEAVALVEPIAAGRADMVIGSRVLGRAEPGALQPHQRFGNWLATSLLHLFYGGFPYTDLGPFRALRVASLRELQMQDRAYGWTVEMQAKALHQKLRIAEAPVSYRRRIGQSKISGSLRASIAAGWTILWTILRLRY